MSKTERQQYKIAGPATWELIRAAYLGGESATTLAERFGVSTHAIRKRITVEKWTKRDYAAALEARGVSREKQKPNFIEEGVLREEMRVAAEAREVAAHDADMSALVEQLVSDGDASGIAAALERRALAQASAAMVQGRSKEAASLAALAEMMRKRVASAPPAAVIAPREPEIVQLSAADLEQRALAQVSAALERGEAGDARALTAVAELFRKRSEEERERAEALAAREHVEAVTEKRSREAELIGKFRYAAMLAYHMVHEPRGAPAIFVDAIAHVRREAFGEGDDESIAAAIKSATEARRYFGLDEDAWEAAIVATSGGLGGRVRDPSPAWARGE